ncbi:MAG TPA: sugar transferase [Firmicutes bacterium]|nr:sugar transferase [Bacillota bacterium]
MVPPCLKGVHICAFKRRRLAVEPGVTGWAQIHGRDAISWDERIRHDIWYVDHWSFWLDLSILLCTVPVVLTRQGLYGPGGLNHDVVSRRSRGMD